MADIEEPLQYGRLIGDFWAILEDSIDPGDAPDTEPLMGTVTFEPSYKILRVGNEDITKRGIVYVDSVTAQVVNGVLVDDFGEPGVSLVASSEEDGDIFPHNLSWKATFNLTRTSGIRLTSQPEPTQVRLEPGVTKSISDFTPSTTGGVPVRVVSVDVETLQRVNSQVDYIEEIVNALGIVVDEGVVKGDTGPQGEQGERGELGPYGPPGRAGTVETINYVTNPVPTSNGGYKASNGTVNYANNVLTLTSNGSSDPALVSWINAVPAFPGTNMYLQFEADTSSSIPIQSKIIFLNANLEPVDSDTLVHGEDDGIDAPVGIISDAEGTFSHMAYTDAAASFAIFSVGFSSATSSGTTLRTNNFYFSDTAGFYFSGDDTIDGYHIRWAGEEHDSRSILMSLDLVSSGAVFSVNGVKGDVVLSAEDFDLELVDNTPDDAKPVSAATQEALDEKLDSSELLPTIAVYDRRYIETAYLTEFSKYATQEVWDTGQTFVDISYVQAPVGGAELVRLTIPGSITGNSASSRPTVEISNDGANWSTWRTLTEAPASGSAYTHIDGTYDRFSSTLKVMVREQLSSGDVTLELFTIDYDGNVTSKSITSGSFPYNSPSITSTFEDDGNLSLYYQNASGSNAMRNVTPSGDIDSNLANLTGLRSSFPYKVSRFYGSYVAAAQDNSVNGSPGIMLSDDGISWYHRGLTGTHAWVRDAQVQSMSAYPGVSRGKVGIYVDYISTSGHRLYRMFATASPSMSGKFSGVSTESLAVTTEGTEIVFPGTLAEAPNVFLTSNDSRLNLGAIAVTREGGTIERFNMGDAPSSNATIAWTAIS